MRYTFLTFTLDTDRCELVRGGKSVALEPQAYHLLVYLLTNRQRVVGKEELMEHVWGGRIVSDAALTTRINAARRAVGDSGKDQKVIRTVSRRGYRFAADVVSDTTIDDDSAPVANSTDPPSQIIRFCKTQNNVRLAYASVGDGPVLVKTANWLNHLEFDWHSPVWRHLLHGLTATRQLIRYDARGNGLSDWNVDEISFDTYVRDLETVVDTIGLDKFPLLGISQGCAVAIAYATRHPDRVTKLILYGGYARGVGQRDDLEQKERGRALGTLMKDGWGRENPAFRHIFTSLFIPGGTAEQTRWLDDLQRITTTPENAFRFREVLDNINVTSLLAKVAVPTLVLHCREDAMVPFDEGRRMAAAIPHADFVPLEGKNHLFLETDPAWPRFMTAVDAFLSAD